MDEKLILAEVKKLIQQKTGLKDVGPSDCKKISAEITRELGRTVSETTIKRLFGFAKIEHKFSRFTLAILLEYVDKEHLLKLLPKTPSSAERLDIIDEWTITRDNARRISELTQKGIKHRSGLPYHMTIRRTFAEKDFENFCDSDHTFMAFVSRPGYGRTILLSQLAERYFLKSDSAYQNSVFLFLNITTFFSNDDKSFDLEEHIKAQLGISSYESITSFVDRHYGTHEGQFVLFLDGFTELILNRDIKFQVFEGIISFLSGIENSTNIKLVLNMRTTTWSRFYEHIRHSALLKSKWYSGNYYTNNDHSNVPLLTEREVNQVLLNIDGSNDTPINEHLKSQLKYPYHLQLYYQLKEEDPTFDPISTCASYELITKFIQEKIYKSNYYTEKIVFLRKLVQLTNYAKNGWPVAKDNFILELSSFKNAYMELISGGIVIEERQILNDHPKEFVRYIHSHIFEYFLFIELLEKYKLTLDEAFFKQIVEDYSGSNFAFSLLKWSVRFVIRTGNLQSLNIIFDLKLPHEEKSQLIMFTVENLKYRLPSSIEILVLLHKQKFHHYAIKYLLHTDALDTSNQKCASLLLEIVDTNEHRLFYHSILSLTEVLELNVEKINARMAQMEALRSTAASWFINPCDVVWLLHEKLNNIQVDQHPVLEKLELFKQNHNVSTRANAEMSNQEVLTYINLFVINFFYGNMTEQIKIIHSILNAHPGLIYKRSSFSVSILGLLAVASARASPGKKTDQMEAILSQLFENTNNTLPTKSASVVYKIMRSEQSKNKGNYKLALQYAIDGLRFCIETELYSTCLVLYNLIVKICMLMQDFEKANEFKYEKYTFIEEKKLPKHLFPLPLNPHNAS